jgi:hypothetical protein
MRIRYSRIAFKAFADLPSEVQIQRVRNNMFNSAGVIPFATGFRSAAKRQPRRPIAHGQL